jgi:NADH:ubiquinone oxidoreductase subunit C
MLYIKSRKFNQIKLFKVQRYNVRNYVDDLVASNEQHDLIVSHQLEFVILLQKIIPHLIKEMYISPHDIEIKTNIGNIDIILWVLKYNSLAQFEQMVDIIVIDVPTKTYRYKINYSLFSLKYNTRLVLSTKTDEITSLKSMAYLFSSAAWLEREAWDLFGVHFLGNKDLRRILTDYGFKGHPLRKDFPLSGHFEIQFDDEYKQILQSKASFAQQYRIFKTVTPWIKRYVVAPLTETLEDLS